MKISRRDILRLAGGSAAGFLFTPTPWKLLDDTAIWTQNWPWMQKPPRGPLQTKYTTCPLCPLGCPVRAQCQSGIPFSLTGVAAASGNGGKLCPMGLSAHHLAYHPARVAGPSERAAQSDQGRLNPVPLEKIVRQLATIVGAGPASIAVLDRQPGRSVSHIYRRFLARRPRGVYLTAGAQGEEVFATYRTMCHCGPLGFDSEHTRTIMSFGAPLLEGRGAHGAAPLPLNDNLRVIHAEARQSLTAMFASQWLPMRPGTEVPLALGLAHVIVKEKLFSHKSIAAGTDVAEYFALVGRCTPAVVGELTGLAPEVIEETARQLAGHLPAVAIGGSDPAGGPLGRDAELAIAGLNFLLGSVGAPGGLLEREEFPPSRNEMPLAPVTELDDVADGSLRLLIMDGAESGYAIPWHLLQRKLEPGKAVVVSLSPYASAMARRADYIVPSPAAYEHLTDLPVPAASPVATFSLSSPLLAPRMAGIEPAEFIRQLEGALGEAEASGLSAVEEMRKRSDAIFASGRGTLFCYPQARTAEVRSIGSAEEFWKLLSEGACWFDGVRAPEQPRRFSFFGDSVENKSRLEQQMVGRATERGSAPLVLVPFAEGEPGSGQLSPVMTKLYREGGVRESARIAAIHPSTAGQLGRRQGEHAILQTGLGSMEVAIQVNKSVMPGVVHVAVCPDIRAFDPDGEHTGEGILALCGSRSSSTWRTTPAKFQGGQLS